MTSAYYRAMMWMWTGIAAKSLPAWSWRLLCVGGFWKVGELLNRIYGSPNGPWPPVTAVVEGRIGMWKARTLAPKA